MKTATKRILTIAALLCTQAPLFGYKFTFSNNTGQLLTLEMNASGQKQKAAIGPQLSHTFDYDSMGGYDNTVWMGSLCLTSATAQLVGELGSKKVIFDNKMNCEDATYNVVKHGNKIVALKNILVKAHVPVHVKEHVPVHTVVPVHAK